MSGVVEAEPCTVRARLIEAADDELAEHGSLAGRFEAVARRAGVSRATAYRQLGSISELLTQVGLRRSQKYITGMRAVMELEEGALAKIEAALIYGARELPNEPIVLDLISHQSGSVVHPEVYRLIIDVLGSALVAGQGAGEIRTDIDLELVIEYLTEQSYLVTNAPDRSEWAVRRRFRLFIEPAIAARAAAGSASPKRRRRTRSAGDAGPHQ